MKFKILFLILSVLSLSAFASYTFPQGIYGGVEGGYDWPNRIEFRPQHGACVESSTQGCWDNANQSFKAPLGNKGFWGGRIGYRINHLFSADVSYDARNQFSWDKTFPGVPHSFPNPRHRYINTIQNQTVMLNLYMTPNLQWSKLDPYIEGGVGSAWNKVGTLTSEDLTTRVVSQIVGDETHSFAWQLGVGANYYLTSHFFFNGGYRFWDLGTFRTGTSVISPVFLSIAPLQANHAYVHEVYIGVNLMS